jgi:hydrogenase small subunit
MWNEGTSFPIMAGHPCIGCSEPDFWDNGPFYSQLANVDFLGTDSNANTIGKIAVGAAAVGAAAHAIGTAIKKSSVPENGTEG